MNNLDSNLSIEENKNILKSVIAAKRYSIETGGITVLGGALTLKTDPESQAKLGLAFRMFKDGIIDHVDWKGSSGWISLGIDHIGFAMISVAQHVQKCFSTERKKSEEIDLLTTFEELNAYDCDSGFTP